MNRTSIRRAIAPSIAVLALSLSLAACGSDDTDTDGGNDAGASSDTDYSALSGELTIGGASSQESAQNAWMVGFSEVAPDVTVSYDPVGSGGGRENFISGGFPMAGSDSYLSNEDSELDAAAKQCAADPIQIPNYISPIASVYNL